MFSVDIEKILEGMRSENIKIAIIRLAEEIERLESEIKGLGDANLF